jgi:hypothetical protein
MYKAFLKHIWITNKAYLEHFWSTIKNIFEAYFRRGADDAITENALNCKPDNGITENALT